MHYSSPEFSIEEWSGSDGIDWYGRWDFGEPQKEMFKENFIYNPGTRTDREYAFGQYSNGAGGAYEFFEMQGENTQEIGELIQNGGQFVTQFDYYGYEIAVTSNSWAWPNKLTGSMEVKYPWGGGYVEERVFRLRDTEEGVKFFLAPTYEHMQIYRGAQQARLYFEQMPDVHQPDAVFGEMQRRVEQQHLPMPSFMMYAWGFPTGDEPTDYHNYVAYVGVNRLLDGSEEGYSSVFAEAYSDTHMDKAYVVGGSGIAYTTSATYSDDGQTVFRVWNEGVFNGYFGDYGAQLPGLVGSGEGAPAVCKESRLSKK